jgi:hypothetical protein
MQVSSLFCLMGHWVVVVVVVVVVFVVLFCFLELDFIWQTSLWAIVEEIGGTWRTQIQS